MHGPQGGEQSEEIQEVEPGKAQYGDQRAADEGSHDRAELHNRHVEADGRGDVLLAHQLGDDRGAGGLVDREEGLLHSEQAQDEPHVV